MYNSTKDVVFLESENGTGTSIYGNISDKFIIPTGLCKVFEGKPASIMRIKPVENVPHMLFISDPSVTNLFQVPWSLMSGDQVTSTMKGEIGEHVLYTIQLKETVHSAGVSCVDYPDDHHESYADCVDAEMRNKILPSLGMFNVHMECFIVKTSC